MADRTVVWLLLPLLTTVGLQAALPEAAASRDLFWEWVGLIALAIVGVVILFVSSEQLKRLKRVYDQILEKEKKLEESQSKFLEDLGENIYETLQDTSRSTGEVIEKAKQLVSEQEIRKIKESESQLLHTTQDLIFFLKLKSKRVEIVPGDFDFYHLMDNVIEVLAKKYGEKGHSFEVRVSEEIPRILQGDSLRLGQVLVNLLENALEEVEEPVTMLVEASAREGENKRFEVEITIRDRNTANTHPAFQSMEPYYDDERREFVGLRIYVARELMELMGGRIEARKVGENHEVVLRVPVHLDQSNLGIYAELPEPYRSPKKVLVLDAFGEEAEALKKGFELYEYPVTLFDVWHCEDSIPNFSRYDLAVIEKEMYQPLIREVLRSIRRSHPVKTVLLLDRRQAVEMEQDPEIDSRLYRPFSQRDIYNLIVRVFGEESPAPSENAQPETPGAKGEIAGLSPLKSTSSVVPSEPESGEKALGKDWERRRKPLYIPRERKGVTRESFADFQGSLLLAEDNRINQQMFRDLLSRSRLQLTIVGDGKEALDRLQQEGEAYDLVLLDNSMPVMDGEEVARILRQDRRYDTLPLVAFTASSLDEKGKMYEEFGFDAFLPKPFKLSQLYDLLEHCLAKGKDREAVTRGERASHGHPVLNEKQGLAYANEQKELYAELLKEFLAVYSLSGTLLRKYQRENSLDQARNLLLDVRGLAATIGAESLYAVVDPLFRRVGEQRTNLTAEDVARYQEELEKLKSAAERYLLEHHA